MNILSFHYGHNATVAFLKDGKIIEYISEEGFNGYKNSTGIPHNALKYVRDKYKNIDYVAIVGELPWSFRYLKRKKFITFRPNQKKYSEKDFIPGLKQFVLMKYFKKWYYNNLIRKLKNESKKEFFNDKEFDEMKEYFANFLNFNKNKIIFVNHHLAHALSAVYFLKNDKKSLIFTLDGEGDGISSSVGLFNNKYVCLSRGSKAFSIGILYKEVTKFLGMRPNEHEFKVMGLAPYSKKEYSEKIKDNFKKIIWINKENKFESDIPIPLIKYYLRKILSYERFDNIAGGIQNFTEEIVSDWVSRWIRKTGVNDIAVAGGVFMNVKLNQKIANMKEVDSLSVVPSCGDESLPIGAAYYVYEKFYDNTKISISKINHLYFGTEYSDSEIDIFFKKNNYFSKFKISREANINKTIAVLLSKNNVVARFSGKREFGARALGNRSILSNPSHFDNIKMINEMIKNRDFWMPFAASILKEDENRYIVNKKNIVASFMSITFDTTERAVEDIRAAIHPYDRTCRPQIVDKNTNKDYYELIEEFKKITGIGAVLNTSFNLHGRPNVQTLEDAMYTFENSGLKYLSLNNYLISKNK